MITTVQLFKPNLICSCVPNAMEPITDPITVDTDNESNISVLAMLAYAEGDEELKEKTPAQLKAWMLDNDIEIKIT
jgi:hypothetical protein